MVRAASAPLGEGVRSCAMKRGLKRSKALQAGEPGLKAEKLSF